MRAHDHHRARFVTTLSLQPLEPRTPLAANITTVVAAPAAKLVQAAAVQLSSVRVQAVATPTVVVADAALVAAGQAATAAKEAGRAAAAGHAIPDVSHAAADSLAGRLDRFGIAGGGAGSQRATTGVPGLDRSVPAQGDGIAAFRERYGLDGGGQPGSGGEGSSDDDVRAAAAAGKGRASDETTTDGETQETIENEQYLADAAWNKVQELQKRRDEDVLVPGSDPPLEKAYQEQIDSMIKLFFRHSTNIRRLQNTPSERPAPDDAGTPPHRGTPPGADAGVPLPRPSLAVLPAPDADAVVRRPSGSVRGQVPTNPAVDHGRDHAPPRSIGSVTHVRAAAFAQIGKVINPLNTH